MKTDEKEVVLNLDSRIVGTFLQAEKAVEPDTAYRYQRAFNITNYRKDIIKLRSVTRDEKYDYELSLTLTPRNP